MSCPIKVHSNTIELTVHSSCYCVLDLLCVKVNNLNTKLIMFINPPPKKYFTTKVLKDLNLPGN